MAKLFFILKGAAASVIYFLWSVRHGNFDEWYEEHAKTFLSGCGGFIMAFYAQLGEVTEVPSWWVMTSSDKHQLLLSFIMGAGSFCIVMLKSLAGGVVGASVPSIVKILKDSYNWVRSKVIGWVTGTKRPKDSEGDQL